VQAPTIENPTLQQPMTKTSSETQSRSSDDIRAWIVAELGRMLNVNPSTIDTAAALDTLGVDSLSAIGITGGLSGWMECDLPATLMWDYASIDAIALGLADPEVRALTMGRPGVVNLQPRGSRIPLFFFPGLGGHPVSFTQMAQHLGDDQPSYGLTVPGLTGKEKLLTNLEEMTTAMLKNMRQIQPTGPYQLAGYSFGGLLAYEAAQQLTAAGESVGLVAMYDTFLRQGRRIRPMWQRMCIHAYLLMTRTGRMDYVLQRMVRLKRDDAHKPAVDMKPQITIGRLAVAANHVAMDHYYPKPYGGPVVRFRASEESWHDIFLKIDRAGGFSRIASLMRVIDLPGNHLSILNSEHSQAAADALKPLLAGARMHGVSGDAAT
jgi:thioesterase domain-containing protein/acyl carrier protein